MARMATRWAWRQARGDGMEGGFQARMRLGMRQARHVAPLHRSN